jgi:hypothetical protein
MNLDQIKIDELSFYHEIQSKIKEFQEKKKQILNNLDLEHSLLNDSLKRSSQEKDVEEGPKIRMSKMTKVNRDEASSLSPNKIMKFSEIPSDENNKKLSPALTKKPTTLSPNKINLLKSPISIIKSPNEIRKLDDQLIFVYPEITNKLPSPATKQIEINKNLYETTSTSNKEIIRIRPDEKQDYNVKTPSPIKKNEFSRKTTDIFPMDDELQSQQENEYSSVVRLMKSNEITSSTPKSILKSPVRKTITNSYPYHNRNINFKNKNKHLLKIDLQNERDCENQTRFSPNSDMNSNKNVSREGVHIVKEMDMKFGNYEQKERKRSSGENPITAINDSSSNNKNLENISKIQNIQQTKLFSEQSDDEVDLQHQIKTPPLLQLSNLNELDNNSQKKKIDLRSNKRKRTASSEDLKFPELNEIEKSISQSNK